MAVKPCTVHSIARDRFRTSVNVLGDAFGAGIVHHLSLADLQKEDEELERGHLQSDDDE